MDTAGKGQFPATYSIDPDTDTYTVRVPGELPKSYDSEDQFRADWVLIKRPFIPESELESPEYGPDSYAILLLEEKAGDHGLAGYEEGELRPLAWLTKALKRGELRPPGSAEKPVVADDGAMRVAANGGANELDGLDSNTGHQPAPSENIDPEALSDEEAGVATFASTLLEGDSWNVIPFREVYEVYEAFAEKHGYEIIPENHFTRVLKDHMTVESQRKWLDGKTRQCYVGIDLAVGAGRTEHAGLTDGVDTSTGGAISDD